MPKPPPPRERRAIVIGGSVGGLFAAILLRRAGWVVEIYERAGEELAARGAGIVTHPALFAALARAGIAVDETIGVAVPGRLALAPGSGEVLGEMDLRQVMTAWGRVFRLLRTAFPEAHYHRGKALAGLDQDATGVRASFADGAQVEGDVLVAADGFRSTVRGLFLPALRPAYAGYVAWRGLVAEDALDAATHAALFDRFAFCLPPHEQMLGYPVAGTADSVEPGRRRYNFVWYRPADPAGELPGLLTDESGRYHPDGIPPQRIRRTVLDGIRATAQSVLAPQFAALVRLSEQPFVQPIYDLAAPAMVFGRVALVGDAAFVARPHAGMGVTKAAEDAIALADALAVEPPEAALARFAAERLRAGQAIVAEARRLGAGLATDPRTAEECALAKRYRRPEIVMRETAVAPPGPAASRAGLSGTPSG